MGMIDRLHVLIDGRVQGVGFRFSTESRALTLGLSGWVRNRADGRVEAEFEGTKAPLEEMLEWCRHGPRLARVTNVEASWEEGEPHHHGFHCRV